MIRKVPLCLWMLIVCALSACNLGSAQTDDPIITQSVQPSLKPTVTITSPQDGSEVVVGKDVFVSANASDSVGVTRVQLVINNQIAKTVSSESTSGDKTMNVLLDFKPSAPGDTTIEVIAYRGSVASDPAIVEVVVRANQSQVTATSIPPTGVATINPNDPTCRALVNTGLNMRSGPGTNFPRLLVINAGAVVPIVGRTGANDWWQVSFSGQFGWLAAAYTTVYGICTGVPITYVPATVPPTVTRFIPPPPTLTQIPPPTVTPGPADLVITSIVGATELTIPAGEGSVSSTYSVTVTNTGSSRTNGFVVAVSITPGGPLVESSSVANLAPGQSIALDFPVTFDTGGIFTFRATADNDNVVPELSEVNNSGVVDIQIVAE